MQGVSSLRIHMQIKSRVLEQVKIAVDGTLGRAEQVAKVTYLLGWLAAQAAEQLENPEYSMLVEHNQGLCNKCKNTIVTKTIDDPICQCILPAAENRPIRAVERDFFLFPNRKSRLSRNFFPNQSTLSCRKALFGRISGRCSDAIVTGKDRKSTRLNSSH